MTPDEQEPLYDPSAPVVCTIDAPQIGPHIETLERMRARVRSVERTAAGVVVTFAGSAEATADIERFVADELRCCQFWGFEINHAEEIVLCWDGPPETQGFMDLLLGYLRGEVPVGRLFGPLQPVPLAAPKAKQ